LEKWLQHKTGKKIKEENISEWRRTVCGDLTSVFRPYNGEKLPALTFLDKDQSAEGIHKAQFKKLPDDFRKFSPADVAAINRNPLASSLLAQQEPGIKPANGLPYELYVDGQLDENRKNFNLIFKAGNTFFGEQAAGSPLLVYAPGNHTSAANQQQQEAARTWNYAAKPGDRLEATWNISDFEDGKYHLRAYGPNGFYREFKGDKHDPGLYAALSYEAKNGQPTGNAILTFSLSGSVAPLNVEVVDNSYKKGTLKMAVQRESFAPQTLKLNLAKSHGWYDFTIKVNGYAQFEKRYAGRVETGKNTFTDPLMGRVV
jgi:phospholipase C